MQLKSATDRIDEVVDVIATANGNLVGRTRLQKTVCLLTISGLSEGFDFSYNHYGPFSQELASVTEIAGIFANLTEVQNKTQWGGTYSVFSTTAASKTQAGSPRDLIIKIANAADPIELELAVTAVFLAKEGIQSAWEETAFRKPDKIGGGRLERAKDLYRRLLAIPTPLPLPKISS